jgi:hypothetical protein
MLSSVFTVLSLPPAGSDVLTFTAFGAFDAFHALGSLDARS